MGDETWVDSSEPNPRGGWWNGSIPKEEEIQETAGKILVTKFLVWERCHSWKLLARGATVNSDYYTETIISLNAHLCHLCPTRKLSEVLFLHDSARLHTNTCTTETIRDFEWTVLLQPPYSPVLIPLDYIMCLVLPKGTLWGHSCQSRGFADSCEPVAVGEGEHLLSSRNICSFQRQMNAVNKGGYCAEK